MSKTDKMLIGIVAGILLVVLMAALVSLNQPEAEYLDENTPEAVAHDYLLALQKVDYPRAYASLSPDLPGLPKTLEDFLEQIQYRSWMFESLADSSFVVEPRSQSEDRATVEVKIITFYEPGLFSGGSVTNQFAIYLKLHNGMWKVTYSNNFFSSCWLDQEPCK